MKKPSTLIDELRQDLRYWQAMARIDANNLRASRKKCQQIGDQMRRLQKEASDAK